MKTPDEIAREVMSYHGCTTGDCPHVSQAECEFELIKVGAEIYREEVVKRFPKGEEAAWRDCVIGDLKHLQDRINMLAMMSLVASMAAIGAIAFSLMKG